VQADWNDGFTRALLTDDEGEIVGWLRLDRWYEDPSVRTPVITWVGEYLDTADRSRSCSAFWSTRLAFLFAPECSKNVFAASPGALKTVRIAYRLGAPKAFLPRREEV
jgi:hypothetical protein